VGAKKAWTEKKKGRENTRGLAEGGAKKKDGGGNFTGKTMVHGKK